MKVIFLPVGGYDTPSSRYRCYYFAEELKKHDFDVTIIPSVFPMHSIKSKRKSLSVQIKNFLTKFNILRKAKNEIIYIQKDVFRRGMIQLYSLFRHRRLVFDFDDAIYLHNSQKVNKMIKISKLTITGNDHLKNYAMQFNKKVYVIPTSINTDVWKPSAKKKTSETIIGWIGMPSNFQFLNVLSNPLKVLSQKYDFTFKIISAFGFPQCAIPDFKGVHVEKAKWSLKTERQELAEVDIGVYPLPDNEWSKGKCGLKTLQYMAMEIPPVCSRVGVSNIIIQDGRNGLLASTEKEWIKKLSLLIENTRLRRQLGKNARITVEKFYSLRSNGEKLANILKTVN